MSRVKDSRIRVEHLSHNSYTRSGGTNDNRPNTETAAVSAPWPPVALTVHGTSKSASPRLFTTPYRIGAEVNAQSKPFQLLGALFQSLLCAKTWPSLSLSMSSALLPATIVKMVHWKFSVPKLSTPFLSSLSPVTLKHLGRQWCALSISLSPENRPIFLHENWKQRLPKTPQAHQTLHFSPQFLCQFIPLFQ